MLMSVVDEHCELVVGSDVRLCQCAHLAICGQSLL